MPNDLKQQIRDAILESALSVMTTKKGDMAQIRIDETMEAIIKVFDLHSIDPTQEV